MISSVRADAFVEAPASGARLTVRKAVMHDIPPILALINGYAAKGIMLPRTEFELSEAIRDFMVVTLGEEFLGCGALHFYTPTIGEIRSLAVHEHAKTHGVGRRVVEALVAEAQSRGINDEAGMITLAQERGWNPADTKAALDGWVQRMGQSMAVGQQFRKLLGY